jgi:hypothetical protein
MRDLYFYSFGCIIGNLCGIWYKNNEIKRINFKSKNEKYILNGKINHLTQEIKMLNDEINNLKK